MLIVHTFPVKDPLAGFKHTDKPDNYFRVCKKQGGDVHMFPFANGNHTEAHWAFEESLRIFDELGGNARGTTRLLWKKHPDFKVIELVGEGARIEDEPKPAPKTSTPRKSARNAEAESN